MFNFFPPRTLFFYSFWNNVLILTFLRSYKRSNPSVVCFVLQVRVQKPTQFFVLQVSIKKPIFCQLLTSFHRSNWMFVDLFIGCVAWSYWWICCVLSIIWNSEHLRFFVFYFNVSNKITFTPPLLLNFQFSKQTFIPSHLPSSTLPLISDTQEYTSLNMKNFVLMFTFSILDLFSKNQFGILVLSD